MNEINFETTVESAPTEVVTITDLNEISDNTEVDNSYIDQPIDKKLLEKTILCLKNSPEDILRIKDNLFKTLKVKTNKLNKKSVLQIIINCITKIFEIILIIIFIN